MERDEGCGKCLGENSWKIRVGKISSSGDVDNDLRDFLIILQSTRL